MHQRLLVMHDHPWGEQTVHLPVVPVMLRPAPRQQMKAVWQRHQPKKKLFDGGIFLKKKNLRS
jgi:hypothetical protein